jgi:hypothetical protein
MEERRRSVRRRLKQDVVVINAVNGDTIGNMIDITPEGMAIKSVCSMVTGSICEMRLLLPVKIFGKGTIDVEVRCVRSIQAEGCIEFMYGFEFVEVSSQNTSLLVGLIMELALPD